LEEFCSESGYKAIIFHAFDGNGIAIYHTNVLMGVGSRFAVICLESITDKTERDRVVNSLVETDKYIIPISFDQMNYFAGNLLEVKNKAGETLIVLSKTAFQSFSAEQKTVLSGYGKLVYSDIHTIEQIGGGSARCMMAEIHLPVR
jgi:hypothetical protein